MATSERTVWDKFLKFVKDLRTDNDDDVETRCKRITQRLNLSFWDLDSDTAFSRYVGSYGRGTAICGFTDVDLLMQLPWATYSQYNAYSGNGQSALLQAVRTELRLRYPNTEVGGDGQVVVVQFSDGMKVEVLPAFLLADSVNYTYPDANDGGSWKFTSPGVEAASLDIADKKYSKKIRHLARMTRAWRRNENVPISGILIDTLAYNFMSKWAYNDKSYMYYDWMMRDFMYYLSKQDQDQQFWFAPGSGLRVWRKGVFEHKAKRAYENAGDAIENEEQKYPYSATTCWQKIFGTLYAG